MKPDIQPSPPDLYAQLTSHPSFPSPKPTNPTATSTLSNPSFTNLQPGDNTQPVDFASFEVVQGTEPVVVPGMWTFGSVASTGGNASIGTGN